MASAVLDGGEDHQLGAAAFELSLRGHMWPDNISGAAFRVKAKDKSSLSAKAGSHKPPSL